MKKLIEYNQSRKHVSKVALNESVASSRMSSKTKPKKSKDFISMNKKLDQSRKENKSIGSQDQMNKYYLKFLTQLYPRELKWQGLT